MNAPNSHLAPPATSPTAVSSAAAILFNQAATAMEQARTLMWVALEKDVADDVRGKWPNAARVGLVQHESDVTDLSEAIVYADGTDDDPDGALLAIVDYDWADPMFVRLDDAFRTLRDSEWEAEQDRYDGEHMIVFAAADAAFEPHRPLVPKPGSSLSRTVYQIEVLHNTDGETAVNPGVGAVAYWVNETG